MATESAAPEQPKETPQPSPEQSTSPEATQTRREKEMGQVISSILRGELKKNHDADNTAAQAIGSSEYYANITQGDIKQPIQFPIKAGTEAGEPITFEHDGRKTILTQITGVTEDNLSCMTIYEDEVDKNDVTQWPMTIPRAQMLEMNILAEKEAIQNGFSGDKLDIINYYMDAIDPNTETPEITDEMTAQMEQVAKQNGMLTADDMRAILNRAIPEEHADRADAEKALQALDGKTILDKEDFHTMMDILGVSPQGREKQAEALRAEITRQKETLNNFPDDQLAKRRLETAESELAKINQMDKLLEEARANGKDPIEEFFTNAQNGELADGKARAVIDGIAQGDFNSLLDMLPEYDASTQDGKERREKILGMLKDGGKFSAGLLGILLGMALGLTVSSVAEALKNPGH